ncbi:MAG: OmpP1/FadL family transporter [Kiritimatiellia bacterium]
MNAHGYALVLRSCLLLGLLLGVPLLAFAQGGGSANFGTSFNPVGSGARAMGQGNAFIAVADDATAASWNPAGLAQLERPECSLAGEYWHSYGRVLSPAEYRSEHETSLADINYASIVYPFRLAGRNVVASLNYLKMYDFDQQMSMPAYDDFTSTWTAQYRLAQAGSLSVVAPAVAVDLTDSLAVGLTFNIWNNNITQNSSFQKTQVLQMSEAGVRRDELFTVKEGYSVVLGTLYRLDKQWTIGGVVKAPFSIQLQHRTTAGFSEGDPVWNNLPSVESDATLNMPLVLGGGLAWRPIDPLTICMDVTWTQWSQFTLKEDQARNPITSNPIEEGRCRDAYTVRIGTEYILPFESYQIPLRCGLGYDPEPGVKRIVDYYTANLGVGIQWGRYALDAAYELRWGNKVHTGTLTTLQGAEDSLQHRVLLSLIVYL